MSGAQATVQVRAPQLLCTADRPFVQWNVQSRVRMQRSPACTSHTACFHTSYIRRGRIAHRIYHWPHLHHARPLHDSWDEPWCCGARMLRCEMCKILYTSQNYDLTGPIFKMYMGAAESVCAILLRLNRFEGVAASSWELDGCDCQ
jgi:hypothetical protein